MIGFAGRFVEEKRPDLLIRALEVVNRAFPEARIVFAGQHRCFSVEETVRRYEELFRLYAVAAEERAARPPVVVAE